MLLSLKISMELRKNETRCYWCNTIFLLKNAIKWENLYFCSDKCLLRCKGDSNSNKVG